MAANATYCDACTRPIQTLEYMECKNPNREGINELCSKTFHIQCLNIEACTFAEFADDHIQNWICPACVSSMPKGDNTKTPIRSDPKHPFTQDDEINVNIIRGNRTQIIKSREIPDFAMIMNEIQQLRLDIQELKKSNNEITDLRNEVKSLKNLLMIEITNIPDIISSRFDEYKKQIDVKDMQITEMKSTIVGLKLQIDSQEQANMRNELEIHGVPEYESENLQHSVLVIAKKYAIDIKEDDLDGVWRVGLRRPNHSVNPTNKPWKPRPIVVKLLRRSTRDEFIKAAKSRRGVTTEGVVTGPLEKISVYERLTKHNRNLFRAATIRIKQYNFSYRWVLNGTLYVRKADKTPAIPIRSLQDLDEKVGTDKDTLC
ncbi:hypothetical protein O0L34_g1923 [Tuta absoluta]|nr:hypothetical protein O0L34_g1923 [Tuta absoluta]